MTSASCASPDLFAIGVVRSSIRLKLEGFHRRGQCTLRLLCAKARQSAQIGADGNAQPGTLPV
jgi:hypothetical protein